MTAKTDNIEHRAASREEAARQRRGQLFGDALQPTMQATDPELQAIADRFVFGEIYERGELSAELNELIALVVLTASQTLPQLSHHVQAALAVGLSPVTIKEAIYHTAPYIGIPKAMNAVAAANEVLLANGIELPTEPQATVTEASRLANGIAAQKAIFGELIDDMRAAAPSDQKHIQDYLSAWCFGDFYTREGLDLATRELLTLCTICTLGGCESQVRAHISGNLAVGNDRTVLLAALVRCLPYIGFPRMLNALSCLNELTEQPA